MKRISIYNTEQIVLQFARAGGSLLEYQCSVPRVSCANDNVGGQIASLIAFSTIYKANKNMKNIENLPV